jgi:hypothetical protein
MTQREKQLLLKDLCARLPYGVKITCFKNGVLTPYLIDFRDSTIHTTSDFNGTYIKVQLEDYKIYLRPISSMTEDEEREFEETLQYTQYTLESYDWLNEHHFDYRRLIEKGLALEAPEGMYE